MFFSAMSVPTAVVQAPRSARFDTYGPRFASILLDAKFFDIRIKDELFTRDQRNVQETPVTFKSLPRDAFNKGMRFE
jgi:hypothetical protein